MNWVDATDLRNWANRKDCQQTLPQLVRKLIRATSGSIQNIKFPSGENVAFGGWDGTLEVGEETEYLPSGTSLWEFGANKDEKGKADDDYKKRTANPLGFNPSECTFIFVTPRLWTKGIDWANEKKREAVWKDVRVINAEMLEEWLEVAPTVASWLAVEHLGKYPTGGIQPTEDYWNDWSVGHSITLKPQILLGGRHKEVEKLFEDLKQPEVTVIQGTSRDEALAFIIAANKGEIENEDFFSRSLIVDTPDTFKKLSVNRNPLILIPRFEDIGIFNRAVNNGHNVIVPLGADAADNWENKITLSKIDRDIFVESLNEAGLSVELSEKYSKESTRNVTILRRMLKFVKNTPDWAKNENVRDIIPALLIGKWDDSYEKDREIIARLAGVEYTEYSKTLTRWLFTSDSPVIKINTLWRIASPLDAWTNASKFLTRGDFDILSEAFLEILGETNPKQKLEHEHRYTNLSRENTSKYSGWIGEGVVQSLILVSVFGDQLRFDLPITSSIWVDQIISKLLSTNDSDLWKSFERHLPLIAEASPNEFLIQVEKHIDSENSPVVALFDGNPGLFFSKSYHTGLLWALEGIAWLPEFLSRSSLVLSKLAALDLRIEIQNKPINSLKSIFKPWYYQTLAPLKERVETLQLLADREKEVAWILLIGLLPTAHSDSGFSNYKLKWRRFDELIQKNATYYDLRKIHSSVVDILISIFDFTEKKFSDLIEKSQYTSEIDRSKILLFCKSVADKTDQKECDLWHSIRNLLGRHRSFSGAEWSLPENFLIQYEDLICHFEPKDELLKIKWLFDDYWPSLFEDLDNVNLNHEESSRLITEKRIHAFSHTYESYGMGKIRELIFAVKFPEILGDIAAQSLTEDTDLFSLIDLLMEGEEGIRFIRGLMWRKSLISGLNWVLNLYSDIHINYETDQIIHILLSLQHSSELWNYINELGGNTEKIFWMRKDSNFYHLSTEDKITGMRKLISNNRHKSVLLDISLYVEDIPSDILVEILEGVAINKDPENVQLRGYEVQRFFDILYVRTDIEKQTIIHLEWLYLPILDTHNSKRGTMLLHEELADNPDFFMEVFKLVYQSGDESDGVESTQLVSEQQHNVSLNAYRLLDSWHKVPGLGDDGELNGKKLSEWISKVRDSAREYGRLDSMDSRIGGILARYPEKEEPWPPVEICEIIESINTRTLISGFSSAVFNKRGFSSRGVFDGGARERKLVEYFMRLSGYIKNRFPTVALIFVELAKGYQQQAQREDDDAAINLLDY